MAEVPPGVKGMNDILPPEVSKWQFLEQKARDVLEAFAYRELHRASPIFSRAVYSRAEEGPIAGLLDETVASFPSVEIGSYPHVDALEYKVKITLDGRDTTAVDGATATLIERLGPAVVRTE